MFTSSHKGIGPATPAGVIADLAISQAAGFAVGATIVANLDTFDAFANAPLVDDDEVLSHREFEDLIDDEVQCGQCGLYGEAAEMEDCGDVLVHSECFDAWEIDNPAEDGGARIEIGPHGEPVLVGGDFVSDFLDQIEARYDRDSIESFDRGGFLR